MKRFIFIAIVMLAAWVRWGALGDDVRFHGDEAYFARYARNAAVYGDWMLSGALDKPPLSIYAMALSMHLTGVEALPDGVATLDAVRGEGSARLAGALAGTVAVALLMAAAQRLGGWRTALFAGGWAALSPQMVAFDATAFTDPLMMCLLAGGLAAAIYGRAGWGGLLVAAAFASKQQAIFYAPLVFGLILVRGGGLRGGMRWLAGFAAGAALLLMWDAARPDPSIFSVAADNNNPYRWLVPPAEWGDRLWAWLGFAGTAFGAPPVTLVVTGLALISGLRTRGNALLLGFALVYTAVHIVLPFNIYDRYLLLIYPPLILLAAQTLARCTPHRLTGLVLAAILLLSLTAPARFPSDVRDRDPQILALADFINRQPLGTIVYNRWLGWEMGYYLGAWSDKRVVYYPTPADFAADAPQNPDPAPRLFIAPTWADSRAWLDAAGEIFTLRIAYRSADYVAWWLE